MDDPRPPRRVPSVLALLGSLGRAGLLVGVLALVAWPVHGACEVCERGEAIPDGAACWDCWVALDPSSWAFRGEAD